jgi:mannose-6-phosphate isomerase-like protein (cupin superfamily)
MKKFNIYNSLPSELGEFHDDRGSIVDLFFKAAINHIAFIESVPGAIRGNHYHALSRQHMFITEGSLEYWYKNESMTSSSHVICIPGDVITSDKNEVHALKIGSGGCKFLALTEGLRGGSDYEKDTFRVDSIIVE